MTTDYESFYQQNRHGLGEPTKAFVEFFSNLAESRLTVLDVGCGQGRDALFIARLGHHVTAIDHSPSGIRDLDNDAAAENLSIQTEVIEIRDFQSDSIYDVIVIDRTLHMLDLRDRQQVLANLLASTRSGSYILLADEKSNIPQFVDILEKSKWSWITALQHRGFLFVERA